MSDEDILERGGTQEDIDRYAHDVGGACGLAYGDTCDYCTTTDNTQDLDKILGSSHCDFTPENINEYSYNQICKWCGAIRTNSRHKIKQAILDWHNKQMLELLDRLESKAFYDPSGTSPLINPREIESERNKLKESK